MALDADSEVPFTALLNREPRCRPEIIRSAGTAASFTHTMRRDWSADGVFRGFAPGLLLVLSKLFLGIPAPLRHHAQLISG